MLYKTNIFQGSSFLITGASSGIGAHISLTLNQLGAKVIAVSSNYDKLLIQKKQAKNPDNFIIFSKDLSEFKNLDKWVLTIAREYNGFNGAVLAAGISKTLGINSPNYIDVAYQLFSINYFGNLQILKGLLDKRAQTKKNSSFVWISSKASQMPLKGLSLYGASKAAIDTTIKALSLEIFPKYRINSILPSLINTPMIQNIIQAQDIERLKCNSENIGKPEDISNLACFLLSDASKWINGQNIIVDGGNM
ncbi:SDR family oxidoreductase [Campylobacter lari]|uniref:SDR family oxidoreductase n=1 Tax=Campylobacter lari TaxID=201 RepID=UPI0012CF96D8|nr:SDR family oxidoreductase [Campylobacter lari]EAK0442724.1 SDR family oxidoreductase [Campylobacter lari]EGK8095007.1 SDR family oxidoreductase [Campylobacter lari]EHH0538388.1 SDR family oxidoreductase [Campylobacter lari]MCW0188512.1 SDR family oxidoreductase [Campylobacter lari]MCW0243571.1 SDR family oxidoreductase [Campylobacter lari]